MKKDHHLPLGEGKGSGVYAHLRPFPLFPLPKGKEMINQTAKQQTANSKEQTAKKKARAPKEARATSDFQISDRRPLTPYPVRLILTSSEPALFGWRESAPYSTNANQ